MAEGNYAGLLCIGDPHVASRVPGFRKDDYPRTILRKLRWVMDYAREHRLLPVVLGDLFHYPRDNANWLLVEMMDLLDGQALAIAGNHDCNENALGSDDTLSVLFAARKLRQIDSKRPWIGRMGGAPVLIGGTCWGEKLPREFARSEHACPEAARWVFWVCHHDIRFPGYEESGRLGCLEIPGVDAVINGHIHRHLGEVVAGETRWINPGNIARVNRGDATRVHEPGVLRIDVSPSQWTAQRVAVPCEPFDAVFYPEMVESQPLEAGESLFIRGLRELQTLKTASGEGLRVFLDRNLDQFPPSVAEHVRQLAKEVLNDACHTDNPTGN